MEEERQETEEKQNPEKHWYVIHTYSGYENKVKANLERKVRSMGRTISLGMSFAIRRALPVLSGLFRHSRFR